MYIINICMCVCVSIIVVCLFGGRVTRATAAGVADECLADVYSPGIIYYVRTHVFGSSKTNINFLG